MGWFRKRKANEPTDAGDRSIRCARCGLVNPETALWCDCGHVFDVARAREAIAEKLHSHVDRPLGGVLFCPQCSRLSSQDAPLCWCGYRFRLPPTETDTTPVKCPSCASRLWLRPPLDGAHFTCPDCSKVFSAAVSEQGEVRVELIDFLTDLEACYATLDLSIGASKEEIRDAFDRRMAEYDLTRSPGVAEELLALATERRRQIRAAYTLLSRLSAEAS